MKFSMFVLSWALSLGTMNWCLGDDGKNETFTDPSKAGADYANQGEFEGTLPDGAKVGCQVIARGSGNFDLVAYIGGLPGEGWSRGDITHKGTGKTEGDKVTFKAAADSPDPGGRAELKGGVLVVFDGANNKILEMSRKPRVSSTLGAKPPKGAIVLFDGSNADAFENGKVVEEKLLGATNALSKEKFGDHTLHLEFRTPFMPTASGQGRGNSGVYMQGRYELQVLDSFGLEGENNECGGIYSIAKPKVNMCFPPLTWQTYDIDFTAAKYEGDKKVTNARVTVKHNGVTIHDNLELTHGTPGNIGEGPEPGALFLQDHGNPVAFRNIWVVKK
jgi:Domain of Unknown Function (DUF1080)